MKRHNWRNLFQKTSEERDIVKNQTSQPASTSKAYETSDQLCEHQIVSKPDEATSTCDEHHNRAPVDPATGTPATVAASDLPKKDYWQLALNELETDRDFPEKALAAVQQAATQNGSNLSEQLLIAIERSRTALVERQWKIDIGNKEIIIREQLEKILKAVQVFKPLGSAVASIDPVHAGLPWAGLCLLMQLTLGDFERNTAILAGAEEIATIISRYNQVEVLYLSRQETTLKKEFETRLIALYKDIIRYQVMAVCHYQRSTMLRFLRSLPKMDDPCPILADVRRDDIACKDIGQVFDSQDAHLRHQEIFVIFKSYDDKINQLISELRRRDDEALKKSAELSEVAGNVHWTIIRPINNLFTGRQSELTKIETAISQSSKESVAAQQKRFIITGLGGQGKSEICLKIANSLRQAFWGVFWVDVNDRSLADKAFVHIAKKLGMSVETFEDARQVLANLNQPWLLILDNADDPNFDYQIYFPSGNLGVILMTSRNLECEQYATIGTESLEGLSEDDANHLLLKAAKVPSNRWASYGESAKVIVKELGSHPLALIQAGSYIARGHCGLHEYLEVYKSHRERLLKHHPTQGQSRYKHVYATFEASASVLENSSDQPAYDALQLLQILSMLGRNSLPVRMFEAAWKGAQEVRGEADENNSMENLSKWHVSQLPSVIPAEYEKWDDFKLGQASHLLISLALIIRITENGRTAFSMHPLTHAWAKDRQSRKQQEQAWTSAGSIIALSDGDQQLWRIHERALRPHMHSLLSDEMVIFSYGPQLKIVQILLRCGWILLKMREDRRLFSLITSITAKMSLDLQTPSEDSLSLFDLAAQNLLNMGKLQEAVRLLERVYQTKEILIESHPSRLASQHVLAMAYQSNGQVEKAVKLLERVVQIREKLLAEDHPDRLASQHVLAMAYQSNGQVEKAVQLLEYVVQIREKLLAEDHPDRLASQYALAMAYQSNGQVERAVQLLKHVVQVQEETLAEGHPFRLAAKHKLAFVYRLASYSEKPI